ncbi:PKD domain-containing protein [Thermoplasmatota archaeon]
MKKNKLLFILLIISLFISSQIPIQADNDYTKLYIKPESKQVSPGETFNITIYCEPTEPIKSYEFDLDFDYTTLHANSVSKGDIFNNSETWFNAGTIDNSLGYIDNVYSLIMENKTVTNSGSLAIISFTAKEKNDTTILHLNDAGITNELGYINYSVNDGTIIIGSSENPPIDPVEPSNKPPYNPNKPSGINFGFTNITYYFATSTSDPDDDKIEFLFDWDDNTKEIWIGEFDSKEVCSYSHSWKIPGVYEIRVKAKDSLNNQSSWSSPLSVAIENQEENQNNQTENNKPNADFSYKPNNPTNQDIIEFTDLSIDIDGTIIKWLWNFGDGSTSELQNPTHIYQENNPYMITLTIWDNNNSIGVSQKEIIIIEKTEDTTGNGQSETPGFGLILVIFALIMIIVYRNKKL